MVSTQLILISQPTQPQQQQAYLYRFVHYYVKFSKKTHFLKWTWLSSFVAFPVILPISYDEILPEHSTTIELPIRCIKIPNLRFKETEKRYWNSENWEIEEHNITYWKNETTSNKNQHGKAFLTISNIWSVKYYDSVFCVREMLDFRLLKFRLMMWKFLLCITCYGRWIYIKVAVAVTSNFTFLLFR